MHIYNWLKKIQKKAEIPGWGYIVALIIGLFVIVMLFVLNGKSANFLSGLKEVLQNII